jgi:glycosyltransferase involved in cell wall biosynthesis
MIVIATNLGISSKLYEYQVVGKPIVCCARGWSAIHVMRMGSGVAVRPGNRKALAEAVLRLKRNPELAEKYGSRGEEVR